MQLNRKLPANVLLTTVILALLIAMTCSSLLLLAYIDMGTVNRAHDLSLLRRNLHSAVNRILADTTLIQSGHEDTVDLFGDGRDSAIIGKENWGLFIAAHAIVKRHGEVQAKCFFAGPPPGTPLDVCLYLAQHNIPLYVSGTTLLTGDAWLPKGGILPSYFDQQSFTHDKPLTGVIRTSYDSLPAIDPRLINSLAGIGSAALTTPPPDSLTQSFYDSAVVFHTRRPLLLSGLRLHGHILVISDSSIDVDGSADLQGIILVAPYIIFEKEYSGTLQAIATDSLIVRNACHFSYPSCLILRKAGSPAFQPTLRIGDSCSFFGVILSVAPEPRDLIKTYVELGSNSTITGFLYSSGFLELKGEVRGSVLTDYFLHRSGISLLQNFLVNAGIDRTKLPANFVGPRFIPTSRPNKIIQWLK